MAGGPVTVVSSPAGQSSKAGSASGAGGEKKGGGDPPKKPNSGVEKNEVVCPVCGVVGHDAQHCPTAMFAYFYARTLAAGVDPNSFGHPHQSRRRRRRRRRQGARHPTGDNNAAENNDTPADEDGEE